MALIEIRQHTHGQPVAMELALPQEEWEQLAQEITRLIYSKYAQRYDVTLSMNRW